MKTLFQRYFRIIACAGLVAALAGCGPLITQSPSGDLKPVNAVSQGDDKRVMLAGHDVVNYFTDGAHKMGDPAIKTTYEDVTFWFASEEHKSMFVAEPQRYMPQYGGYCTNGIAYGIPWGGDADNWKMFDGKLYIFGGIGSMKAFLLDTDKNMALAEQYWADEVKGSNAFLQRTRRLMFKVPHYKSGEELAAEIAAAEKKKAGG